MTVHIDEVAKLVGLQLGVKKVEGAMSLREDLGAESLDVQNIIMTLEDKYKVQVDDEVLADLETVNDILKVVNSRIAAA